ncbi:MAG TPA: DUF4239 domain-containing protein [Pseudolabrys sp.]|nr:DUF4239 domain-containing protein [Pseudolabrys sp.]
MIEKWLDLPEAGVFGVLAVLYGVAALLIAWLTFGKPFVDRVRAIDGVVAPFFGAASVLFALLTGFLANDIATRNAQALRAVQVEANELQNVFTLSVASASDMRSIRAALLAYVKSAIADDWPAMENDEGAAKTEAAYSELLHEVSDPKIAKESGEAVHAALLNATVRAGTARSDRIALASDRTTSFKWEVVLVLGVITQISIAIVHLQRRGAQIAALTVFSAAVVVTLGLIALQERPFGGAFAIAPASLQEFVRLRGGG